MPSKVALVTGGDKGIGFAIGRMILSRIPTSACYFVCKSAIDGLPHVLSLDLGKCAYKRAKFSLLDIRDIEAIKKKEKIIKENYGGLDILVNNASIYAKPDPSIFAQQAKELLETNYHGTVNFTRQLLPIMKKDARIVNITAELAHVKQTRDKIQMQYRERTLERFSEVKTCKELDDLVEQFKRDAVGNWHLNDWPTCAFSVSKMAVNTFTRLLQKELDEQGKSDIIVNAVYPGTHHSETPAFEDEFKRHKDEDGAWFVYKYATVKANEVDGHMPRGAVIDGEETLSHSATHDKVGANFMYGFNVVNEGKENPTATI